MDVNIFKMLQSIPIYVQPLIRGLIMIYGIGVLVSQFNSLKHSGCYMGDML